MNHDRKLGFVVMFVISGLLGVLYFRFWFPWDTTIDDFKKSVDDVLNPSVEPEPTPKRYGVVTISKKKGIKIGKPGLQLVPDEDPPGDDKLGAGRLYFDSNDGLQVYNGSAWMTVVVEPPRKEE